MSIWIDKHGTRHVAVMADGRRTHRRMPPGTSAGDAKQLEADLRRALGQRKTAIPGDPPLIDLLAAYIERAQKTLRSPDTARDHAMRAAPWAERYRASEADRCAEHMVRDMTGHYAPATINRSLGTIKAALTQAWRAHVITENYGARIRRLPEHNERHEYPTIDAVHAITNLCSAPARAAIWIALLTGARRGEVCAIDPAKHVHGDRLDIPASHTKTLRIKSLPIIAPMRPWLEYFPLAITVDGVKSAFRRARVKAGYPTVRFHDLRHACASLLIEHGVDLYTVAKVLGHTNIKTTMRYAHLQLEQKRSAMELIGTEIDEKLHRDITPAKRKRATHCA